MDEFVACALETKPESPRHRHRLVLHRLGRRRSAADTTASAPPRPPRVFCEHRYPETAGDPQFDYGVDDPSLPEQPDAGVQEPDATVDDDPYYTGGAYYYVLPADDDQE